MIRPATVDGALAVAHVAVEGWRSTYRELMSDTLLARLPVERWTIFRRQVIERAEKQFVFVATDEQDNIVEFVNGGLERERDTLEPTELYALYLLQDQQGNGHGRALMLATMAKVVKQGYNARLLWVLSTNPARGFYKAMGGQYLKTKPIEIGGETLEEVAYS